MTVSPTAIEDVLCGRLDRSSSLLHPIDAAATQRPADSSTAPVAADRC